jgi:hypothetical protein
MRVYSLDLPRCDSDQLVISDFKEAVMTEAATSKE